jgi:hypothetical protein
MDLVCMLCALDAIPQKARTLSGKLARTQMFVAVCRHGESPARKTRVKMEVKAVKDVTGGSRIDVPLEDVVKAGVFLIVSHTPPAGPFLARPKMLHPIKMLHPDIQRLQRL